MQSMTFDRPVLLLGNAPINAALARWVGDWSGPIVCADGGVRHLPPGRPIIVVGDMDSYQGPASTRLHDPDQDSTDFDKCLACVRAPELIGVGFLGGRWDHSLAALSSLARARDPIRLVDHENSIVLVDGDYQGRHRVGDTLGVIPMQRCQFDTSHGLAYPLDGVVLELGVWVGSSNRITDTDVSIRGQGRYWLSYASPLKPDSE